MGAYDNDPDDELTPLEIYHRTAALMDGVKEWDGVPGKTVAIGSFGPWVFVPESVSAKGTFTENAYIQMQAKRLLGFSEDKDDFML